MYVEYAGLTAFIVTICYICLGLPAQIVQNRRRKSVEGLSLFMYTMMFLTAVAWAVYGMLREDWYILASNLPCVGLASVVIWQFYAYRGEK